MAGKPNKTTRTDVDPELFIAAVEPQRRRDEAKRLLSLMREATGEEPFMFGPSIVGFGLYTYRYPTGREGDMVRVGFSPRKAALTIYGLQDDADVAARLDELGPHSVGAGCVYIKRLDAIDESVLRELVAAACGPKPHEISAT
jgi:hypothetical protein